MPRKTLRLIVAGITSLLVIMGALSAQPKQVSIPDTTGRKGDTLLVPIQISTLSTLDSVYSGEFTLVFNSGVVQVLGIETAGSLSDSIASVLYNATTRVFAFASTSIVTGSGPLVYLKISVQLNPAASTTTLDFSNARLNEGTPAVNFTPGSLRILAIQIVPKTPPAALIVGDSLQFSVSGDQIPPLEWTSSDTLIGTISPAGLLRVMAPGQMKVHVRDAQNLRDSSNLFPVFPAQARDLTISMPDTQYTQTLFFNLPIYVTDVSVLDILSAQISLTYSASILQAVEVVQANSMISGWSQPSFNVTSGRIDLALAGSQALSGSGILVYVRFRVQPTASGSTTINAVTALFNETLTANIVTGQFTALTAPTVVISPNTVVATIGDSVQFQVTSGGTPPYQWTSAAPGIASINSSSGLLVALARGTTTVTVVDSFGFTATSSTIVVNSVDAAIADTAMGLNDSVDVPLSIEDLSTFTVFAFEARIVYDSTIVRFTDMVSAGTLSNGFTFFVKDTLDTLRIAAAGTTPISSGGVLVKLRFKSTADSTGVSTPLVLDRLVFNESDPASPTATRINGSIAIVAPPPTPVLILPADGAMNTPLSVVFQWSSAARTSFYRLQVSTNPSFTAPVLDEAALLDTNYVSTLLTPNTLYHWRISAMNAGGVSAFSAAWTFTTVLGPTTVEEGSGVPGSTWLEQNYPNPFNPTTVISFQLSAISQVRLSVYNLLGVEVSVIAQGIMPAGTHSFRWDASSFANGTYFYRLRAGERIMTRKLVLLK